MTTLWYFLGKLLPVLVFTGAAPQRASSSSGNKLVSQNFLQIDSREPIRAARPDSCCESQKNPRAHENEIGTSTPPLPKKTTPLKGGWGFSSRKTKNPRRP